MDNFREQHCRLCLSTVNVEHFKEIKNLTKSLDVRFLKLNLDNSSRTIMCNVCTWRVMEASRFKSMCVSTNNAIIPYVDDETGCCIDLKEIYIRETGTKHLSPTLKDYKVCRLCMQLIKDKFIPAHEMAIDMIKMYIPEINLTAIEEPVICKQCFNCFSNHSNFIKNCLGVNEGNRSWDPEIVDKSIWIPTGDSLIKTEEVDIKPESEEEDQWLETNSTVVESIYKGISNKTNHREIKTEDGDQKRLPRNVKTRKKWLDAIPKDLIRENANNIYICGVHFTPESFQPASLGLTKNMLRRTAIPSIFDDLRKTPDTSINQVSDDSNVPNIQSKADATKVNFVNASDMCVYVITKTEGPVKSEAHPTVVTPEFSNLKATADVAVQVSLPTDKERELQRKLYTLQKRLERREARISSIMTDFKTLMDQN